MFILNIFRIIPLFAVLLGVIWGLHGAGSFPARLTEVAINVGMPSGASWQPTWGDVLVLIGLCLLFVEIFKSTSTSKITIADHVFSTITFVAFLIIWIIFPWTVGDKGDSTFMLLTMMSFIDVIAGFTITISTARRDFGLGGHAGG